MKATLKHIGVDMITNPQIKYPMENTLLTEIMVLREKNAELVEALKESKSMIGKLRRSISVHPDCTIGSEFDDYTTDAQNLEDEIESLINSNKLDNE